LTDEKIRVHELAKKHSLTSKAMQALLQELGVMAKSHMTVLTDEEVALVAEHFEASKAESRKAADKAHRFVVEKAKPKVSRLSAREKLAAERHDADLSPAKGVSEGTPAAAASSADLGGAVPAVEVAEPEPIHPVSGAGAREGSIAPKTAPAAPAPAPRATPSRLDMGAVTRAAAETRARMESELRTRPAVAPNLPGRPARAAGPAAAPQPARAPQRDQRGRPRPERGRPDRPAAEAPEAAPRERGEIDSTAIRKSVRETLARLEVPRRAIAEPALPVPRKKPSRKAREEKKERTARLMAEEQEQKRVAETLVRITEFVTVQELAEKLGIKTAELIAKLIGMGTMATINQRLDKDTIELVVSEYGSQVEWLSDYGEDRLAEIAPEPGTELPRQPVVTVMGHVDHGKTTLLDTIRKTNVVAKEAGGITQHIGAYRVATSKGMVTFLDTPGHEAFTAMRARGAQVTDIVIVVVAADDKVMPQTTEAIDHARASKCPIIIAINKIDLPSANPMAVKQQLTQHGVLVEEYGGEVQSVEISAKQGTNIDKLLSAIAVQAEVMELKAVRDGHARGTVIESKKDPGRGVSFTVLVNRGTLRVGDAFVAGMTEGRVRSMRDEWDKEVREAGPGQPVVVFGAGDVPTAGDQCVVLASEREAKEIAGARQRLHREQELHAPRRSVKLDDVFERIQEGELKALNLVIKGDVAGSVEALSGSLIALATPKVAVHIVHSGVGAINENDIMLAAASDAIIIGFHLHPSPPIRERAKRESVSIELYNIIYEAVDDVKKAMEGLLDPVKREVTTGAAEVRQLFKVPKLGTIAGSYVTEGMVKRNSRVRVIRDQVQLYESTISSLRRFKDDAREVQTGFECGIGVEGFNDLKVGDVLQTYEIQEIRQQL
jgi:translation initiation factor IF-2